MKGGVWTNVEDEILKAAISKYGGQQWARISSLLVRKTPKQCKARWTEWLDPSIRKTDWSKEEDEKLLHMAKLMPTQWRSIAGVVGRTATQCLERYQKLLDDAETSELALGGPQGGETQAPSADDIRRLRPGEIDPDPETRRALPDAVDMDEDEKEMLSEARARLANTQGKKAKRKARERMIEETKRLASLNRRRELKAAGISSGIRWRKKGDMDYNADIPFEKQPVSGFYDTTGELEANEAAIRKVDMRNVDTVKRRAEQEELDRRKRQKMEREGGEQAKQHKADIVAQARERQLERLRNAEERVRRRQLIMPEPQVTEAELEGIVKMGVRGESVRDYVDETPSSARGFLTDYSGGGGGGGGVSSGVGRTPRTPAAPDHLAAQARRLKAMTQAQSSLLGGEDGVGTDEEVDGTGFEGVTPRSHVVSTPNALVTPYRQPVGAGATPSRTPRDHYDLNAANSHNTAVAATPREAQIFAKAEKKRLQRLFAALPKPENEIELALPEEEEEEKEQGIGNDNMTDEDAEDRDRRLASKREAEVQEIRERQSQVIQRGLPRPSIVDVDALLSASYSEDSIREQVSKEALAWIVYDARAFPVTDGQLLNPTSFGSNFESVASADMKAARLLVKNEAKNPGGSQAFVDAYEAVHANSLPGMEVYGDESDERDEDQKLLEVFEVCLSLSM